MCAGHGIAYGDRFIQFGDWRFGDVDGNHASIAHINGKTAVIYRSDGTVHEGPRGKEQDSYYTTWKRRTGFPFGVSFGSNFIEIGEWRIGDVDGHHGSIAHRTGQTARIFRSDGTVYHGPRKDYTTWAREVGSPAGISIGYNFIEIGGWRMGDVDGWHASIAHVNGETAQIFRSDGTLHPGPRSDYTTWTRNVEKICSDTATVTPVYTMYGCPYRRSKNNHPAKCGLPTNHNSASVRCCSKDKKKVNMKTTYGCQTASTLADAEAICTKWGLHVCSTEEINARQQCGSGCGFDNQRVWTSSHCQM